MCTTKQNVETRAEPEMASLMSHTIKGQGSHRCPGEAPVFLAIGPDREPWWDYTMPPGWGREERGKRCPSLTPSPFKLRTQVTLPPGWRFCSSAARWQDKVSQSLKPPCLLTTLGDLAVLHVLLTVTIL